MRFLSEIISSLIVFSVFCFLLVGCENKNDTPFSLSEDNKPLEMKNTAPLSRNDELYAEIVTMLKEKAPAYEQMETLSNLIQQKRNHIQEIVEKGVKYKGVIRNAYPFTYENYELFFKTVLNSKEQSNREEYNKILGDLYLATLDIEKAALYYRLASDSSENSKLVHEAGYLSEISGDYRSAESSYVKLRELIYDKKPNHYPMGQVLMYLGNICQKQRRYHDAMWHYRFSIKWYSEKYGKEFPYISTIRIHLANVHIKQGHHEDALKELKKAIPILTKHDDKRKLKIAEAHYYLSQAYYDMDNYNNALRAIEKAIEIQARYYGKKHIVNSPLYTMYGLILDALKEHKKAMKYHNLTLKIDKSHFGENHKSVGSDYSNIGSVYFSLNNYKKDIEYTKKAIEIYSNVLNANHPDLALAWHNLAASQIKLGQKSETINSLIKAYNIYKASLGVSHPKTKRTKENLAKIGYFIN